MTGLMMKFMIGLMTKFMTGLMTKFMIGLMMTYERYQLVNNFVEFICNT